MPPPPSPPSPPTGTKAKPGRSCLAAAAVLLVYLIGSAMLLMLPTGFIGPVFVLGGFLFVAIIGLHYFVWGRWLTRILKQDAEQE